MPKLILIDTGPLIALVDKDDKYHNDIKDFIKKNSFKFVSTTTVVTEVTHMLDFNINAQIGFLEWIIREGIVLHEISQKEIIRVIELCKKYQDRPMDFADATLVVTAKQTGLREIISIDTDFNVFRIFKKERIENIFRSKLK
jgi:predicted nucleic acid-binding protein